MKSIKIISLCFLQILFLKSVFAQQADIKNANDVLNKNISALGGKEYLSTVKTLYTDIATEMDGRQVNWVTKEMLPNKGSFQIVYNDKVVFHNWFDGKTGYEIINGKKTKADAEEFKSKKNKKNIFNELDYIDTTLWKLELMEDKKVNDEDCYKVKATSIDGEIKNLFFSKKTFLCLREDRISNAEKDSFTTTLFSDYQKFGNLTFYTVIKFGEGDKFQVGKIISLLINEKITEKDFN